MDQHHDETIDLKTFCLLGFKAMTYSSKPVVVSPMSRKMDRQDIRNSISLLHTQKSNLFTSPRPRPPNITAQARVIGQCHHCLNLTTFRAIEKAYEEKEKEEGLREWVKRVMEVQNHRNKARACCKGFTKAQRTGELLRQEQEREKIEKTLKMQRTKKEQEVQLVHQRYLRFLMEKQKSMMEQETVKRFSQHHGALTKTFSKHYAEQRLSGTRHERRSHIAICTQHTGLQAVQENLENR